jgi:hypothetical protein
LELRVARRLLIPETEVEAGVTADAGSETDAGVIEVEDDAGVGADAGVGTDAGVEADAGVETDVGVKIEAAGVVQVEMVRSACCGSREANTFSVVLGLNSELS